MTFSAGVTAWRPAEALEAALERADEALYEAKRTGVEVKKHPLRIEAGVVWRRSPPLIASCNNPVRPVPSPSPGSNAPRLGAAAVSRACGDRRPNERLVE